MQMITWPVPITASETQSQYAYDPSSIPVRQLPPENGIRIAVEAGVKPLLFLTLTCCLLAAEAEAALHLQIDLSNRELAAVLDGEVVERYSVAIGNDEYPTPTGEFKIRKVIWNPAWRPPDSKWARDKDPKPAGHPENPMKRVKMFFKEPEYYIHGTADEDSLGAAESHGCIRMRVSDVTRLAQLVMEQGGKPMPEPWYRRIFRRKTTKVVYLTVPVSVQIRG
jgi:lipoprotein-anchoring transpeptidase ErfK/SrfK